MSKKTKITTKNIIESLDLPQDIFLGLPNLSLCGNREVYISNHRGILSYKQDEVVVITKEYQIMIHGRNLSIALYSKDELIITGYIRAVEFI